MVVWANWALLATIIWTFADCQAFTPQRTYSDIEDQLDAPTSQRYSIYILPGNNHGEHLRKRQVDYADIKEIDEEPLPEPEPTKVIEAEPVAAKESRIQPYANEIPRDQRIVHHDNSNAYGSIPGFVSKISQVNPERTGYASQDPFHNLEILSFKPNQASKLRYVPDMALEVPHQNNFPVFITSFDPELQPGYGHEELEDKMDSYAVLDDSLYGSSTLQSVPITEAATARANPETYGNFQDPTPEPEPSPTEAYGHQEEKFQLAKKLLNKPKKMMKVIKTTPNGDFFPEEVPGVMLMTPDGNEEAFVPADLLEETERLLASASAQQPTFIRPDTSPPQQQAPTRGMPYSFGWIVDDEATANYQTRQETGDSDGVVTGCYQVLDPTGLVRTVIYRADENGFRIISLSRGPDKTPCPGLDGATRAPTSSVVPTPRPRPQPRPAPQPQPSPQPQPTFNPNINQGAAGIANQNFFSQSSSSSSSSESSSSSSQSSNQFSAFSGKNGLFEQPAAASKTLAPANQASTANQYNLQGSAQEAWMAEYLQNITKNLYNSFTNSSTIYNTNTYGSQVGSDGNLVNFPFVLIPISTFLDLQKNGAIGKDIQSYGAFIQPEQGQAQLSQYLQQQQQQRQQQQQQKQKTFSETTKQTTFNTFNTTKSETEQKAHKVQGVNTINYNLNGARQQAGQQGKQAVQQQQYQSQQSSSQASKSSSSSSSSSSSNFQGNFAGNQGSSFGSQFNQARPTASSYGSKPKPGIPGLSYGPPPKPNTPATYAPRPTQQIPTRPPVARPTPSVTFPPRPTRPPVAIPTQPRPTTPLPNQYRPTQQNIPQVQPNQNFARPSFNNGAFGSFSSQNSQSSKQSQSSQDKQSSSSSAQFGNGAASQSFQSSSSKNSQSSKSDESSSSSQFSQSAGGAGGAGGGGRGFGNQFSSSASKSSKSSSSSSSSSSSQKAFNSFSGAGANGGLSFLPAHLTQGFPSFPDPNSLPSSITPTFVTPGQQTNTPSGVNIIPQQSNKPAPNQAYQEESRPVIVEEPNSFSATDYQNTEPGVESSFIAPAPEPHSDNMDGWIPLTGGRQSNSQNSNLPNTQLAQQGNTASPPSFFAAAQQFNPPQVPQLNGGAGNFHYTSSSQKSQEQKSSQQSNQQSSSSFSSTGGINPQQFFSKAIQQSPQASQKQPRQLPQQQAFQIPSWVAQQQQAGR